MRSKIIMMIAAVFFLFNILCSGRIAVDFALFSLWCRGLFPFKTDVYSYSKD
jgi:hypothetical protein